jgi:hypothetical protein
VIHDLFGFEDEDVDLDLVSPYGLRIGDIGNNELLGTGVYGNSRFEKDDVIRFCWHHVDIASWGCRDCVTFFNIECSVGELDHDHISSSGC